MCEVTFAISQYRIRIQEVLAVITRINPLGWIELRLCIVAGVSLLRDPKTWLGRRRQSRQETCRHAHTAGSRVLGKLVVKNEKQIKKAVTSTERLFLWGSQA